MVGVDKRFKTAAPAKPARPLWSASTSERLELDSAAVSKICAICGKKPGFGQNRSHSMVATKRRFNPNLQRVRVFLEGKATRAYVCTRCLKGGKVQKAV
jgi:large subunit ribosomal protein L28